MGHLRVFDLSALRLRYGCRHFVETGTGTGDSLAYAACSKFDSLFSIEIHPEIAAAARSKLQKDTRIRIEVGKSGDVLPELLAHLPPEEPILFWLDAHFPGADFGLARYDAEPNLQVRLPLEQELEIIRSIRPGGDDVILIDDLRIYEQGPFTNGNIPDWAQTLAPDMRHVRFVDRLFTESHLIERRYEDEGYLVLLPRRRAPPSSKVGKRRAMKECGKAVFRRLSEPAFATRYFIGRGLDIGSGDDPLTLYTQLFPQIEGVECWDLEHGDAGLLKGVAPESYDFVHSSHCLEHMVDPAVALSAWFQAVRPGGHLILLVPDEDLYEQGVWPSTFNGDHKYTFTIAKEISWSPVSINLIDLVRGLGPAAEIRKLALIEATFRENLPRFDQTLTIIGECAVEVVIRKRPQREVKEGGRTPPLGDLPPEQRMLLELSTGGINIETRSLEETAILQSRLRHVEHEGATLRAKLEAVYNSKSWRLTEPLRRLMRVLRRGI